LQGTHLITLRIKMKKSLVRILTILALLGTVAAPLGTLRGSKVVHYADLARIHGMGRIHRSSKDIARMIMLEPERTYLEIGNHFGVTKQRVGAIARRLDIARYTKGVRDDAES
jgi:hypothetical protein